MSDAGRKDCPEVRWISPAARVTLLALALAFLSALPYFLDGGLKTFIPLDDETVIGRNEHVLGGLSLGGGIWAFTSLHASNWYPLTWLSHMAVVSLFGLDPWWHHAVNVALHAASASLLFLVMWRLTAKLWRSAFLAALFGIHPLHVESVAWVTERSDVLSGLFFMLVLLAYERYVRRRGRGRYLLVFGLFACGLMSKPTVVTLPFVLLLLDFWPLGRHGGGASSGGEGRCESRASLFGEKVPLLALTAAASVITLVAQRGGGAVSTVEYIPPGVRVANALVSYVIYLAKAVWPASLAVVYPHSLALPSWWKVAGSLLVFAAITVAALRGLRSRPFLVTGWLWYLGMLVPMIGLVQVGSQAMADRFTYLPLVGFSLMLVWWVPEVLPPRKFREPLLGAAAGAVLVVLLMRSEVQVGYWRDGETLFRHTLAVTQDNWKIEYNMANHLWKLGQRKEAIGHYEQAVRILPGHFRAHNNLGNALFEMRNYDEALKHYRIAVQLRPDDAGYRKNLGLLLTLTGRQAEAAKHLREAERLRKSP